MNFYLEVFVWIHGGSFTGDWNPNWYNTGYQVAHGNFVSVIVNYRLGIIIGNWDFETRIDKTR